MNKKDYKQKVELYQKFHNLLVDNDIDVNHCNFNKNTPLLKAIRNNNWRFLELHIKNKKVDFNKIL